MWKLNFSIYILNPNFNIDLYEVWIIVENNNNKKKIDQVENEKVKLLTSNLS